MTEMKNIDGFKLLPAKPGTCPKCAVKHEDSQPHNQQSLYWQYYFYADYGRWPTWADAMAHCDEQTKSFWVSELAKHGIIVESAKLVARVEGREVQG